MRIEAKPHKVFLGNDRQATHVTVSLLWELWASLPGDFSMRTSLF
jgi:hypothetical protein